MGDTLVKQTYASNKEKILASLGINKNKFKTYIKPGSTYVKKHSSTITTQDVSEERKVDKDSVITTIPVTGNTNNANVNSLTQDVKAFSNGKFTTKDIESPTPEINIIPVTTKPTERPDFLITTSTARIPRPNIQDLSGKIPNLPSTIQEEVPLDRTPEKYYRKIDDSVSASIEVSSAVLNKVTIATSDSKIPEFPDRQNVGISTTQIPVLSTTESTSAVESSPRKPSLFDSLELEDFSPKKPTPVETADDAPDPIPEPLSEEVSKETLEETPKQPIDDTLQPRKTHPSLFR